LICKLVEITGTKSRRSIRGWSKKEKGKYKHRRIKEEYIIVLVLALPFLPFPLFPSSPSLSPLVSYF